MHSSGIIEPEGEGGAQAGVTVRPLQVVSMTIIIIVRPPPSPSGSPALYPKRCTFLKAVGYVCCACVAKPCMLPLPQERQAVTSLWAEGPPPSFSFPWCLYRLLNTVLLRAGATCTSTCRGVLATMCAPARPHRFRRSR